MSQDQWHRVTRNHVNHIGLFERPPTADATATEAIPLPPWKPAPRSRTGLVIAVGAVVVLAVVGLVIITRGQAATPVPAAAGSGASVQPATAPLTAGATAARNPADQNPAAQNPATQNPATQNPATQGPAAPAGTPPPGAASSGPASAAETRFADDVLATPGLHIALARTEIVAAGKRLCTAIPTVPSHAALIGLLIQAKFDPRVVEVFLTAAEKDLCPQESYGQGAVS